ncbi:hypothetical protein BS50DRAFT_618042 [Corynespora cassiicola Philippines]|uniref:Uncharacterized protein n=1 Tax=Corynespora cassiicola Philippines TaxID=1448308 RepID=A0A2T2NZL0_CORCC|nr:hypothetical protein BS50DRAFT_618042 [Corynespora cassiicola Philippines]
MAPVPEIPRDTQLPPPELPEMPKDVRVQGVACAYAISGMYCEPQRALLYFCCAYMFFLRFSKWITMTAAAYIMIFSTTAALHIIILSLDSEWTIDLDIVAAPLIVYTSLTTGVCMVLFTPHNAKMRVKVVIYIWIGFLLVAACVSWFTFWEFHPGIKACIADACENTCNSDNMHFALTRAIQDDLKDFLHTEIQGILPDLTKDTTNPLDLAEQLLLHYKGNLDAIGIYAITQHLIDQYNTSSPFLRFLKLLFVSGHWATFCSFAFLKRACGVPFVRNTVYCRITMDEKVSKRSVSRQNQELLSYGRLFLEISAIAFPPLCLLLVYNNIHVKTLPYLGYWEIPHGTCPRKTASIFRRCIAKMCASIAYIWMRCGLFIVTVSFGLSFIIENEKTFRRLPFPEEETWLHAGQWTVWIGIALVLIVGCVQNLFFPETETSDIWSLYQLERPSTEPPPWLCGWEAGWCWLIAARADLNEFVTWWRNPMEVSWPSRSWIRSKDGYHVNEPSEELSEELLLLRRYAEEPRLQKKSTRGQGEQFKIL